jgi:hypothetical protein
MPKTAHSPNLDSLDFRSALIREILLAKDTLDRHPRAGFVYPLPGDIFLDQASQKAYQVIQGEWSEFPVQNIPLSDLLEALKAQLAKRKQLTESRIAHLVQSLDTLDLIIKAAESGKLDTLDNLISVMQDEREKKRRR